MPVPAFSYDRQLLWKTRQVTDLLRLQAGLELPVNPAVASPRQYHYRSKITPHFDKPKEGGKPAIGFLKAGSRRDVVDVPQCPIAMECINEALPLARKSVYQAAARFKRGATILLRASEGTVITNNNAVACERVGDLEFHFLAGDFSRIILSFFRFYGLRGPTGEYGRGGIPGGRLLRFRPVRPEPGEEI